MHSLILSVAVIAGTLNFQWSSEHSPQIRQTLLGDRIVVAGAALTGKPGAPLLPLIPLRVALPLGAVVDRVELASTVAKPLSYSFMPMPAQMGVPLSRPEDFRLTAADPEAYSRCVNFSVSLNGQGTLMGYPVADVVLTPVSWDPVSGELSWIESTSIVVDYHFEDSGYRLPSRSSTGSALAADIVAASVINPFDMPAPASSQVSELPWGDYLIIADDDLAAAFEPLAQFKTEKGIPAEIVPLSYITGLYAGIDDAQKLRFFLHDIYQNSPPTYILLAGDTPGIPHRNCYATAEGYVDSPSADLYFQDMNDTAPGVDAWNLDGDGTWGELNGDDNMDYHPDYVLGRASVETVSEANIFVNKVIAWENSPDTGDWYTSMGFTTGILWSSPYCPGSAGKEKVDTLYTPDSWTITKLYDHTGTQSYAATMSMLNTGMQLVNHAGHGSETSVSIGTGGYLDMSDFMGLTNISANGRPSIWNSIACLSGSFDTGTCLAEAWIRSPGGGGFCIMNTRYGWGEPAEPGDQWSDLVDQEFFANFFIDGMFNLGVAYMMAKDDFIALIPSDTHYDWIAKSNTLFGDPELPMYLGVPAELEIDTVFLYEGLEFLAVHVTSGGIPLEGARVCLLQGEWDDPATYAVGITDAAGNVTLTWPEPMPAIPNTAKLTVWARDHVLLTGMHEVGNLGTEGPDSRTVPTMSLCSSNPVHGTASIAWTLPDAQTAELKVIDLAGRTVESEILEGTEGVFTWQTAGSPSGVYFARMSAASGFTQNTRIVVVR